MFARVAAPLSVPVIGRPRKSARRVLVHHCLVPLFSFEGLEPVVSPAAWIAPTATLVGDVRVEDDASVWYGAVLRADFGPTDLRRCGRPHVPALSAGE